jgi:hypothetical protein
MTITVCAIRVRRLNRRTFERSRYQLVIWQDADAVARVIRPARDAVTRMAPTIVPRWRVEQVFTTCDMARFLARASVAAVAVPRTTMIDDLACDALDMPDTTKQARATNAANFM